MKRRDFVKLFPALAAAISLPSFPSYASVEPVLKTMAKGDFTYGDLERPWYLLSAVTYFRDFATDARLFQGDVEFLGMSPMNQQANTVMRDFVTTLLSLPAIYHLDGIHLVSERPCAMFLHLIREEDVCSKGLKLSDLIECRNRHMKMCLVSKPLTHPKEQ